MWHFSNQRWQCIFRVARLTSVKRPGVRCVFNRGEGRLAIAIETYKASG
jgi:hypothetical protein